jgi:hypothetical protein
MKRFIVIGLILAAGFVVLASCASISDFDSEIAVGGRGDSSSASAPQVVEDYDSGAWEISGEIPYGEDAAKYASADSGTSGVSMTHAIPANAAPSDSSRKLIKGADVSLESLEFDSVIAAIEQLVNDMGGYVEYSSTYGGSVYDKQASRNASYTLRIPTQHFEAFLSATGDIGSITNLSRHTNDVTDSYFDTASRLKAAQIRRDRLLQLLENAQGMSDIIELENALSNTIYELENYQGTLNRLDNQVDYSVISVYVSEVVELTEVITPPKTLGERISAAFSAAGKGFISGLESLIVWAARNIFGLVVFLVIVLALVIVIKVQIKKSKRRRQAQVEAMQAVKMDAPNPNIH